jgi:hypothetical protein
LNSSHNSEKPASNFLKPLHYYVQAGSGTYPVICSVDTGVKGMKHLDVKLTTLLQVLRLMFG